MDFLNDNDKKDPTEQILPIRNNAKPAESPLEALKKRMLSENGAKDVAPAQPALQLGFSVDTSQYDEPSKPIFITEEPLEEAEQEGEEIITPEQPPAAQKSLLEKLERYTIDESGQNVAFDQKPLYELQSVADIIKSDGESVLASLSKKYDITIDHLGKADDEPAKEPVQDQLPEDAPQALHSDGQTMAFKKMVSDSIKQQSANLFEPETQSKEPEFSLPDISDIDSVQLQENTDVSPKISDTATIRFTPVTNERGDTQRVSVSSITRPINLSLELGESAAEASPVQTNLELTEFEAYTPKLEAQNADEFGKVARHLAIKKRSAFISVMLSCLSLFVLLLFLIPALSDIFVGNAKVGMIITGSIWAVALLANLDIFKSIFELRSRKASADLLLVLPSLSTAALTVSAIGQKTSVYHIILASAITLFIRALSKFFVASANHSNLKIAAAAKNKKAVSLISEPSTTYAMAKNSIEGDVLVAAPRKVQFISNFMKHSTFSVLLSGNVKIISLVVLALSAVCAVGAGLYYNGLFYALYCLCALCSLAALPTLFFIDTLPVFAAAKKLNRKGSMIAGKAAAEKIELANAATVDIADIFPAGSITLNDMKVLTHNNIDRTLINAAALCDAIGSPLAPILKNIANSSDGYPAPSLDTLKYEERLGISGWVNDELLFIGNRTLLEAHGIAVPSVEVDRRILKNGFFPVYVAQKDTACALLIVKYTANSVVASALRRVTSLGVTLLITNCDPNVNEEMIADYFGVYPDLLKVMSNAGVHILKTATAPIQSYSAPAVFSGSGLNFLSIISAASRIRKSNFWLTLIYVLAGVLSIVYFAYAAFAGTGAMPQLSAVLLYQLATCLVSLIIFLFTKP